MEQGENACRLIARVQGKRKTELPGQLAEYGFWEPAHFVMERKMLLEIERRAEAEAVPAPVREPEPAATV